MSYDSEQAANSGGRPELVQFIVQSNRPENATLPNIFQKYEHYATSDLEYVNIRVYNRRVNRNKRSVHWQQVAQKAAGNDPQE